MSDRTYKVIELVGISEESFSAAVDDAIERADQTLTDLSWFEVVEHRGSIQDGAAAEYQVKVKVAFELE
jgi:flavin-binding protein dodecin